MKQFLASCRQCYALIGLGTVITLSCTLAAAGWALAVAARALGYLPYTWEACSWQMHGCSTESYSGPESFLGYLLFGGAAVGIAAFLINVLAYVLPPLFFALDKLGHNVVNHISKGSRT
jgi:hypothetical protein